jgi:hypothetical protein
MGIYYLGGASYGCVDKKPGKMPRSYFVVIASC